MTTLPPFRALDRSAVQSMLASLISIPSVNPAYDATSPGENDIGDAIERFCGDLGCHVSRPVVVDGRRNLVARLAAAEPRQTLLIEGHLDTVGALDGQISPRVDDDGERMYGRGACDVKGGVAAALLALADLAANPLHHTDVVFLGAVDEEHAFRGITHFIASGDLPDAAIVLEPTEMQVVTEHNGVVRVELLLTGLAAHTSRPQDGRNAIRDALVLVDQLEDWNTRVNGDTRAGEPTRVLTVTTISGGSAINVVPDSCRLGVDLRIRPREKAETVRDELAALLFELASQGITASIDRELLLDGGMYTASREPIVRHTLDAIRSATGSTPSPTRVSYGTDGSKLARAGVPTIVFGPGSISQAHGDDEWVAMSDVVTAARVLLDVARAFDRTAA